MPYQGPWSECNHCNNNMLAIHKHNASALSWYTQRYHDPRTEEHGSFAGANAPNIYRRDAGRRTPDHASRTTALDERTPNIAYFGHAEIRKAA
jgi:hypothetical protein